MLESELQFLLMCAISALFFHSVLIFMRGFRNSTSWFCMLFAANTFSQSLFAFPAGFIGNPYYIWMIGLEESTVYLQIIFLSLISLWMGHLMMRRRISSWVNKLRIPRLRIQETNIEIIATYCSLGGSIIAILASVFGAYGYFINREYLYNPPIWIDSLRLILSFLTVLAFVSFVSLYRRVGSLNNIRHYLLITFWVTAGLLSGFKGQVMLPFILLFVSSWIARRLSAFHFLALGLSIFFAYVIVEPMREIAVSSLYRATPYDALVQAITDPFDNLSEIPDKLMDRLDYSTTAVWTLTADRSGQISNYKTRIMESYELMPLLAFVPRALWPGKPLQDLGRELSIELSNNSYNSISPSGPVASYLTGGYIMVIVSSALFGVFTTFSGELLLKYSTYPARYIPILVLAFSLSIGDTYFSYYLIAIVRILLFTYFCYFLLRVFHITSPAVINRA